MSIKVQMWLNAEEYSFADRTDTCLFFSKDRQRNQLGDVEMSWLEWYSFDDTTFPGTPENTFTNADWHCPHTAWRIVFLSKSQWITATCEGSRCPGSCGTCEHEVEQIWTTCPPEGWEVKTSFPEEARTGQECYPEPGGDPRPINDPINQSREEKSINFTGVGRCRPSKPWDMAVEREKLSAWCFCLWQTSWPSVFPLMAYIIENLTVIWSQQLNLQRYFFFLEWILLISPLSEYPLMRRHAVSDNKAVTKQCSLAC